MERYNLLIIIIAILVVVAIAFALWSGAATELQKNAASFFATHLFG